MAWPLSWVALLLAGPAVQITTCTMGSDDAWLTSLIIWSPLAVIVLACIWFTQHHHSSLVWLSLPLVVIVPYCIYFAGGFLVGATFQGHHLCTVLNGEGTFDGYPSSWWARWWAPLQLVISAMYAWVVISCWRAWFQRRQEF